jgi:hypothetical protein
MAFLTDCRIRSGKSALQQGVVARSGARLLSGWFFILAVSLFGVLQFSALAQRQPSKEEIEAAFLYNFAKFVEWPTNAFAEATSPIVIGVLGNDAFGGTVRDTIRTSQPVNGRRFAVEIYKNVGEIKGNRDCHILFVQADTSSRNPQELKRELDRVSKILDELKDRSILTVSEDPGYQFAKLGGIVNFYTESNKIRFEINPDAAKGARLKISSKLLNLARIVRS